MILYVDSHDCANCRDERAGVRRFARLAGWDCLFEQVFQMLRRGLVSHAVLADTCGFRSVDTLRREFRRRTGMSISDWCRK